MTTLSHVMRYGDLGFKDEPVGDFYGDLDKSVVTPTVKASRFYDKLFNKARKLSASKPKV
jgi:hypothetical protein